MQRHLQDQPAHQHHGVLQAVESIHRAAPELQGDEGLYVHIRQAEAQRPVKSRGEGRADE